MDAGLVAALEQEEKGYSVDLIPQVGVKIRSRCVLSPNAPVFCKRKEGIDKCAYFTLRLWK